MEYSSDLIAKNSVISSNFETIVFRTTLIILILYISFVLLKHFSKVSNTNASFYRHSSYKTNKREKFKKIRNLNNSRKGSGRIKLTQINDFL